MLKRTLLKAQEKIISQDFPCARLITFNKPKALNALDLDMVRRLHELHIVSPAPESSIYIQKGAGGKAFCAGGDVISITKNEPKGCQQKFFYWECQMVHHLLHKKAANISLWDGFVMGAGSAVSIPGKYRVATEKAIVATPEPAIGMVHEGGSFYLPRFKVPGMGACMALTTLRVKGADLFHMGIATHYVPSSKLGELEKALCNITDARHVEDILNSFQATSIPPPTMAGSELEFLADTFHIGPDTTMSSILEKVKAAEGKSVIATHAAKTIPTLSPTALCLTLEMLKRGSQCASSAESLKMDYCISQHITVEHDFPEGVRALLIDKDKAPKWKPATLAEVTPEFLSAYFKPTFENQIVWHPTDPLPSSL